MTQKDQYTIIKPSIINGKIDGNQKPTSIDNTLVINSGTTLNNRYDILEVIGSGGMGTVYKALDKRDIEAGNSRFIAIKVLNNECKNNPLLLKSLYQETKKTQSLSHPNIVTVYDFDRDSDLVYMTMELIEGAPLNKIIKRNSGGVVLTEAIDMIAQIGSALAYAHSKHIIHLDLKPSNIYFDQNKNIKILDFGIAQKLNSSLADNHEPTQTIALSPSYASVELLNDEAPCSSDDIYAFACVCYELLTGRHPYNRERAGVALKKQIQPERIKSLNNQQWNALKGALALQKQNRIESIEKFLVDFNTKKSSLKYYILAAIITSVSFFSYFQFQNNFKPSALLQNKKQKTNSIVDDIQPKIEVGVPASHSRIPVEKTQEKEQGKIKIWTDKKSYEIGSTLLISFNVDRALYVRLFVINSAGEVTVLFPNSYQSDNLLKPDKNYQIPPKNAEFTIDISEPKGKDRIIALASSKPFSINTLSLDEFGNPIKNDLIKSYVYFETSFQIK